MIKARKDKTLILGLSDENIKRLRNRFSLSDLKYTVFIIAGKTEESMALTMKQLTENMN